MTAPWKFRARRRERTAAEVQQRMSSLRSELRGQLQAGEELAQRAEQELEAELGANRDEIAALVAASARAEHREWSADAWTGWLPDGAFAVPELRIGSVRDVETDAVLAAPVTYSIHGEAGALVLVSRSADERAAAHELLRSLVVRASACFPKQIRLALLDPAHHGATFPMSRRLERVLLGFDDTQHAVDELIADLERLETSYLDRYHPVFEQVPLSLRLAETRQIVVAASYPTGYEPRAQAAVHTLATRGARAGIHVIVHVDLEAAPEAAGIVESLELAGACVVEMGGTFVGVAGLEADVAFDEAPTGTVQEIVFQKIAATPRRDHPIRWAEIQDIGFSEWWHESSDELVATPIGRAGADQVYDLWLGSEQQLSRACGHGIVVGNSSSDRRSLFDSLLAGLATRYSPEELRFHLVESGDDPSFESWRRLVHTEVLALTPSPEQVRNSVATLLAEAERRLREWTRSGVDSFEALRARGSDDAPRILAVIDGYEQMFVGDVDDRAGRDLRRLVEIGGRAGIHVILGGRRFDQAGPLHRAGVFDILDLRVALPLAPDDALGRDEFGVQGVRLVQRVCDRPFRAVINSMRGHDEGNLAVQLASLDAGPRDVLVERLNGLARDRQMTTARALVLNGAEQPQLAENPHLVRLAEVEPHRRADAVREFARTSPALGGLGTDDWMPEEHPMLLFVGQEETIHGQAHLIVRRRPTENLAVIMQDRDLRIGTLTGLMVSSVITQRPSDVELWVVDRGPVSVPSADVLRSTVRRLGSLEVPCRFTHDVHESEEFIRAVGAEVGRRRELSEAQLTGLPSILLVLADPERISGLNRVPTAHGVTDSPLGLDLRYTLMQGPAVGVHLVLATSSLSALRTVLADSVVHQEFRHRLVTRLPEEDSFTLVRSSAAAALTNGTGRATTAMLFDGHTQGRVVFKPYSAGTPESGRLGNMASQVGGLLEPVTEQLQV